MNTTKTYVTLLTTSSYLPAVITLKTSLDRVQTQYPLLCLVTEDIKEEELDVLRTLDINIQTVQAIHYPQRMIDHNATQEFKGMPHWQNAFTKFQIFNLTQFEKIVYLDADLLIVKNIDHLFEYPHMSGVADAGMISTDKDYMQKGDRYHEYFNAGLMVIEPSAELYEDLLKTIEEVPMDRVWADQNILGYYFKDWPEKKELQLGDEYNVLAPRIEAYAGIGGQEFLDKIAVIHFIDTKPYMFNAYNTLRWEVIGGLFFGVYSIYLGVLKEGMVRLKEKGITI